MHMPKASSEQLFRLIKSLSKSEKRQFRLISTRLSDDQDKKFLRLFDVIDQQKIYDEQKILKKIPAIPHRQLPNQKAHLSYLLMKSLRFHETKNDSRRIVTTLIENAYILYNKCLYDDALQVIEKAKKKANEFERHELLLELIQLEKKAMRQAMKSNMEERSDVLIEETKNTLKSIQYINQFSNLSVKLNSYYQKQGFIRSKQDLDKMACYLENNLPDYKEERLSTNEKIHLYAVLTGYYLFIHDFRKAHQLANKWINLFNQNHNEKSNHVEMYIRSLNTLLVTQNKLGLYDDFMKTHRQLVAIKRDKSIYVSENISLNLFKTIYLHEINRHFMLGEFKSGTRIVSKLERELNTIIHKLDKNSVLIFYYKIACLYFGSSNFKTALKWLNLIIREQDTDLREDLHAFARILRLICYFELGDREMIEMNIRATYRFLLRKKELGKYETAILKFFRDAQNAYSPKEIIELFKVLKLKMLRLEKDKFEKRAFNYFDIISYLESKIQEQSIEYLIKEKLISQLNKNSVIKK